MRLALSPCSIQSAAVAWRSACSAYFAFGAGGGLSPSWRLRFIGYPTYPCFASPRGSRRMLRYQFRPLEGHTAPTPGGRLFSPPRTRDLRSTRSTCAGWVERLSGLSSCKGILLSRFTCSGVQSDEKLSGDGDPDDHLWLSSSSELVMERAEAFVEAAYNVGNQEQVLANACAPTANVPLAGLCAAVVSERRQANKLDRRLDGIDADLGQLAQEPSHCAIGEPLGTQCGIKARPQRIVIDHRGDLSFQCSGLTLEQRDHLVDAVDHLLTCRTAEPLLLNSEIVGDLSQPCDQRVEPQLCGAWRVRRLQLLGDRKAGDDGGIESVGLFQDTHRLGVAPHALGVGQAAGNADFPQRQEGHPLKATGRFHRHELHVMSTTERGQLGDPRRIVIETRERSRWRYMSIQPALRNIHSTDDLGHGNLPCTYDWKPTTVRSCVTVAKIPGSPTVVAGGRTGDIAKRRGRWPPAPALSRFHRTKLPPCGYKGCSSGSTIRGWVSGTLNEPESW